MKLDTGKIRVVLQEQVQKLIKGRFKPAKPLGPVVTIGCDYGASKIILLEVEKGLGKPFIRRLDLEKRPDKDGGPLLKQCFENGYEKRVLRTSVKGQSVLVRFAQFPRMSRPELASAITYEAENYIPFKADEVLMDFHIIGDAAAQGMMDVLLIAVKKEQLYSLVKEFQDADLKLECIDVDVLASINALQFFYPEDFNGSAGLLDIGTEISTLSIIKAGQPRFIRDISFGGVDIAKRLRRKLGISKEEAEKILTQETAPSTQAAAVIKEGYETLCSDLKVTLDYYLSQSGDAQPLEKLFIGGGSGDPETTASIIRDCLRLPVQLFTTEGKVDVAETVNKELLKKCQSMLAVAMGLCLRE